MSMLGHSNITCTRLRHCLLQHRHLYLLQLPPHKNQQMNQSGPQPPESGQPHLHLLKVVTFKEKSQTSKWQQNQHSTAQ
jgi:hypothetical protein